ncbi:MAG: polysaccharide biosynthesis C-terminal domain-containing protein [Planctomycetes bacterium]|nr:polysaccharide biosynthesis C-terminal domain-containing protein [Planctomycetota bacterium]
MTDETTSGANADCNADWEADQRTLKRDTLRGAIVNGTGLALGILTQVVLAKTLSIEGYGIYTYVITMLGLIMLATRHGWDVVLIRYVAAYREREEWGPLRGLLRRGFTLPLIVTGIAAVGLGLVGVGLDTEFGWALVAGAPVLVVMAALTTTVGALNGLGRVVFGVGLQSLLAPIVFLSLIVLASLTNRPLAGEETLLLFGAATLLATLWGGFVTARELGALNLKAYAPVYRTQEWLRVAIPLSIAVGADLLLRRTDVLLVGALMGTTQAGIYRVGVLAAVAALTVVVAVELAMLPLCSRQFASGNVDSLRRLVRLAALISFVATILGALGIWVLGEPILRWVHVEFAEAYPALLVLMGGQLVAQLFGPTRGLAMMASEQRAAAWASGIGVGLNVALNLVLIPLHGLVGAALATAIALLLTRVGLWFHLRRAIGVDTSILSMILPTPPAPAWAKES